MALSDRDRVRLEIGDTDVTAPLFTDEELDDLLERDGGVLRAAAHACRIMAARSAPRYDFDSLDQKSFKRSREREAWQSLAADLDAKADRDEDGSGGLNVVCVRREDAYSDRHDGADSTGHVRAGYFDPDEPIV